MEIKPVTKDNVEEALSVVLKIFPYEDEQEVRDAFMASLDKSKYEWFWEKFNLTRFQYFAGVIDGKIIGTTGIYCHISDKNEANWVGWMCVLPEYRGRGLGKALLQFCIDRTREEGKPYLRLYTSDEPNERIAQKLYEKAGFVNIDMKPHAFIKKEHIVKEFKL